MLITARCTSCQRSARVRLRAGIVRDSWMAGDEPWHLAIGPDGARPRWICEPCLEAALAPAVKDALEAMGRDTGGGG